MPRSPAAPIDPRPKRRPSRRSGWIIGLGMLAMAALAGCQSTVDGQAASAAGSTTQQAQSAPAGPVQLSVPIELRGVGQQYQCQAPTTSPQPTSVPSSGFGSMGQPTAVMHDLNGTNCYTVTQPLLVLQSLASISVVQAQPTGGNDWGIDLKLAPRDRQAFATLTQARVGTQIALVVRGAVLSAPTIEQPIVNGDVQISGDYSQDDARRIVRQITG